MFQIITVRKLNDLAIHEHAWNQLTPSAPLSSPMMTYSWIAAYFQYRIASDEEWICIFCYSDDTLLGVLPLLVSTHDVLGFSWPVLRTPRDEHTKYVDMLISSAANSSTSVSESLLETVKEEYPNHFWVDFNPVLESSPTYSLAEMLKSNGHPTLLTPVAQAAYLRIEGTFEEYRASLAKKFRGNLNNAKNKLQRLGDPINVEFIDAASLRGNELQRFMEIEAASWKGEGGSAILRSEDLVSFYKSVTDGLVKPDMLLWCFLNLGGRTIASNMCIKIGGTLFLWKLGYDNEFSKCSPGSIMFEELVKFAYESENVNEINLMTEPSWCEDWAMTKRKYYNLKMCREGVLPVLSIYYPQKLILFLKRSTTIRKAYWKLKVFTRRILGNQKRKPHTLQSSSR